MGPDWQDQGWGLVFTTPTGAPMHGSVVTHAYQEVLSSLNMEKRPFNGPETHSGLIHADERRVPEDRAGSARPCHYCSDGRHLQAHHAGNPRWCYVRLSALIGRSNGLVIADKIGVRHKGI